MTIYIIEALGVLNGPVDLPVIPGIGMQLPSNAVDLANPLLEAASGHVWALVNGKPKELADHRGVAYRTDTGEAVQHGELGALPAGLTSFPRPSGDHRWIADRWQIDPELRGANLLALAGTLCTRIDTAADAARAAVVGDPTRTIEYERSAAEAAQFKAAGYPADDVPRTVAAWAINGRTAHQAADSILAEAAAYTEALYVIRETRLGAKEQIRTLMDAGEVEQAQHLADQTVAAIEATVSGVGNAAA